MGRSALLVVFLALLAANVAPATSAPAPPPTTCGGQTAEAILVATREAFRARKRPPYVIYTISRYETVNGEPDFTYTYRTRIWYRASDGAALTRRVEGDEARGSLVFEKPRFNAALDPGPPTADIFERAPPPVPQPEEPAGPGADLPEIGSVTVHLESDYKASIVSCDVQTVRLRLEPWREPDRNRLRELWIDRATGSVKRFIATDRLYWGFDGGYDPDVFDATLGLQDGVPVIRTIHGDNGLTTLAADRDISDYRFDAISFPANIPDWYFEPSTYREHIAEAPTW